MKPFLFTVLLKRVVLDTMSLKVQASSLDHAYEIAERFVEDYPNNTGTWGNAVRFSVTENRDSVSSETVRVEHEKENDSA